MFSLVLAQFDSEQIALLQRNLFWVELRIACHSRDFAFGVNDCNGESTIMAMIVALVLSLLALPAFGVRQEGALTFSNFKRGVNAHGHRNTKLATIDE